MREIKFRAWHRDKKMWFPIIAIGLMDGWIDLMPAPDSSWVTDLADVELVQFTGFRDCDGKEIYGGDWIHTHGCSPTVWIVEMFRGTWCGITRFGDGVINAHIELINAIERHEAKVIGNIYAKHELLEDAK